MCLKVNHRWLESPTRLCIRLVLELIDIYRSEIVPLADILTPNQFELELLTQTTIVDEAGAWAAMQELHDQGVTSVVLTSLDTGMCPCDVIHDGDSRRGLF